MPIIKFQGLSVLNRARAEALSRPRPRKAINIAMMTAGRRDWIIICQLRSLSTTVTQYEWLEAFLNKESDMKWQFENESDMGQIYYMTRTRFPKTLPELELMMDSLDLWTTPRNYYYGVTHLSPVPRFFIDTMKRYYDEKGKGEVLLNK